MILSEILKKSDVGLAFGSGRSTIYFAKRLKHFTGRRAEIKFPSSLFLGCITKDEKQALNAVKKDHNLYKKISFGLVKDLEYFSVYRITFQKQ